MIDALLRRIELSVDRRDLREQRLGDNHRRWNTTKVTEKEYCCCCNDWLFSSSSGIIREGESFLVGPLSDGTFLPCRVTTIHRYRVPRRLVRAGQAASLSLPQIEDSRLRKVSEERNERSSHFTRLCLGNGLGLFDLQPSGLRGIRR